MAAKIRSIDGKPTDEKHERNLKLIERWTLVSDEFDYERFNEYRIDGGTLTFTDPKVN